MLSILAQRTDIDLQSLHMGLMTERQAVGDTDIPHPELAAVERLPFTLNEQY